MEYIDFLRNAWFVLIGVLFIGYSILDGFDLGVGMLLPFIAKTDKDKKTLIDSIWPVWDGNEVWLLTGAGALFAAFPFVYASVFSGFYILFMVTLFALIFRAVSMEFWYYDERRRPFWITMFSIGSFLPPLLLGLITGNILLGIPLDDKLQFSGSFSMILRPFPVVCAILAVVFMIMHGATYVALKTEGSMCDKAERVCSRIWYFAIFILIAAILSVFMFFPGKAKNPLMWILALLLFAVLSAFKKMIIDGKAGFSFVLTSVAFAVLWICASVLLYPNLVNGLGTGSLSIYNASSSELTLTIMLIFALIGVPIVLLYTIYVYRIFKGKVRE
jgi:cytochrome bd ubiquinol oxidase subunit II